MCILVSHSTTQLYTLIYINSHHLSSHRFEKFIWFWRKLYSQQKRKITAIIFPKRKNFFILFFSHSLIESSLSMYLRRDDDNDEDEESRKRREKEEYCLLLFFFPACSRFHRAIWYSSFIFFFSPNVVACFWQFSIYIIYNIYIHECWRNRHEKRKIRKRRIKA